jgi:hypothetical protein
LFLRFGEQGERGIEGEGKGDWGRIRRRKEGEGERMRRV